MLCAVVILSFPAVLRACSTLPPGQEARVGFIVEGLNSLPLEFVTSADKNAYPGSVTTKTEAEKNIQKVVKKAIMKVIKEEAKNAGVGNLATDIARQIKPTVRYTPINCAARGDCTVDGKCVTRVKNAEIPANYREFTVNLLVSNYVIGGWGRERWELTLLKVEKQLRKDKTYEPCFKTASITLLYP